MTATAPFKTGSKAFVVGCDLQFRETLEPVTIAPTRKYMLPLPDGFLPIRFADGGVLIAHTSRLRTD